MQQLRRPWTAEEDEAVGQIVQNVGLKNWPLVSSLMAQKYNIEGRSGKQCRQRWHNQINPQVNKKPWTVEQQNLLFESHKKYRNKWIQISKLFIGRTDNSIKNHFYSTIRRSLRRICKLLGNKNSTSQLRSIKPSILSEIFQYSQLNGNQVTAQNQSMVQNSKMIAQELLNFSRIKPKKELEDKSTNKEKLESIITKLNDFSRNYQDIKNSNKKTVFENGPYVRKSLNINESLSSSSSNINSKANNSKMKHRNKTNVNSSSAYDWDQFQKKCMFVKFYLMQNQQNQMNQQNEMVSKNQTPINYQQSSIHSMPILGSFEFNFNTEEKDVYKTQTMTPKSYDNHNYSQRRKGFQLFNSASKQKIFKKQEYDSLLQNIKKQIGNKDATNFLAGQSQKIFP